MIIVNQTERRLLLNPHMIRVPSPFACKASNPSPAGSRAGKLGTGRSAEASKRRIALIIIALGVAVFCASAAQGGDGEAGLATGSDLVAGDGFRIAVDDAQFSVDAAGAPLSAIMEALADHAGFRLVLTAESREAPITAILEDQAWRAGLKQLLKGWHYALLMDEDDRVPLSVVLTSRQAGDETGEASARGADAGKDHGTALGLEEEPSANEETSLEEAMRIARELNEKREDPFGYDLRQVVMADEARARLEGRGPDADRQREELDAEYARRLERLGRYQGDEKLEALAPALAEDSREVRTAALRALRDGTVQDLTTLSDVREMAISDPDYAVRREAFEVYVRYGDQDDVLAMAQEMGRAAGPLQDIAVREWVRIEQERASAADADQQLQGRPRSQ